MQDVFVYGPLADPVALAAILAGAPANGASDNRASDMGAIPARLAGFRLMVAVQDAPPAPAPMPVPLPVAVPDTDPSAGVDGLLLRAPGAVALARLAWLAEGLGLVCDSLPVQRADADADADADAGGVLPALVWRAADGATTAQAQANPDHGRDHPPARRAAVEAGALALALAGFDRGAAARDVLRRWPHLLVQAASALRARDDVAPTTLRRAAADGDVSVIARRAPYANFFAVEEADLRLRRFDGAPAAPVTRAAFMVGDAVAVLPYDPVRDSVLLVEQFRPGAWGRGDPQPWLLEPVAGRIDAFETPDEAAHRETAEEAGIALSRLLPVARYYPSPGAVVEFHHGFIGLADLPHTGSWLGGLAAEDEDIRSHVIAFDRLMALVASGEAANAPLLILALWLSQAREGLRAAAVPG